MTKLEQLYQTINSLKDLGLSLSDEIMEEADRLEEELIRGEIIPRLTRIVDPIVMQIQRPVVLRVEYVPEQPVTIQLTRRDFSNHKTGAAGFMPIPLYKERKAKADRKNGLFFRKLKKA